MTFHDLEVTYGSDWRPEASPSSLTEWYVTVRDVPLHALEVGDVCRALRQELYVSELLPHAVSLLSDDVLAGDRYDGELLAALASLKDKYWQENKALGRMVVHSLIGLGSDEINADLSSDISKLIQTLNS